MATMIPNEVNAFTTDGERTFFRFLQSCAKPDDRYTAWYLPDILGREPDFLLYAPDAGLVILEVKDWALDQIIAADPQFFTLYMEGKEERRKNPLQQIREYFGQVMDKIKEDGYLVSRDSHSYGQVKVTVNSGVVFPNINKHEYEQKGLHQVIPSDRIFFWDDLHPQSPICSDTTGQCFRDSLERMLKVKPRFSITGKELNHLRQLIFPQIRIDLPPREAQQKRTQEVRRLKLLDHLQESLARQYDGGHRIITGPSGSGKTLILVHRAALLKRYNPAIRNILFVCYNITLVNYVRRLLSDKHIPLGEGGVEVLHFFELCGRITGEEIPYEKADTEYYDMVIQDTLEKLTGCLLKYDAVLVDEGQDFSDDMLRIVMALLNPVTNHLAIALDENQNIYQRRRSWKELGIQAQGRVHRVTWVYRNTQEIANFAMALVGNGTSSAPESADALGHQGRLFPETFEAPHGAPPDIRAFPDYGEIATWVADRIWNLSEEESYPLSEMAVIYAMKTPENDPDMILPLLIAKELDKRGLLHNWISEDYRAKRSYDVTTESVTISTIHSVKGFDYACVFLLGLDWLEPGRWTEEQIRRLAYVAVTRAREKLFIPYCSGNELISRLHYCPE
ncbi:MAG: 3'-5' exonuclease [Pseudomonadota bacterium]